MVLLLITALLPIMLISVVQGVMRLAHERARAARELSDNALAMADSNQNILGNARNVLGVAALDPRIVTGDPKSCMTALVGIRDQTPGFANLIMFDAAGKLHCAAVPPSIAMQVDDYPAWNALRNGRSELISGEHYGRITKKRVVTMMVPLRDAAGGFRGALGASIDLDWLDTKLRSRLLGRDIGVAVIDATGHPLISNRALPRFDPKIPAGALRIATDSNGERWFYALAPIVAGDPAQPSLYVVYAAPETRLFSAVWWLAGLDFTLPVLAILLASLAIWLGAQRLVLRWLVQLQRLARHFSAGEYRTRPIDFSEAPREIRGVAASLYRMAVAIDERDGKLHEALDRQSKLTREIHHRVKNNFQLVMSLLSLQASRLPDGEGRRAINLARGRVSALALVHRLLYDSDELSSVSSRALLGAVCGQLQPARRGGSILRLHCDFDDVPLDIDNAVPLTLWMVEAVNNAFAHGFPPDRGGEVKTVLRAVDGRATLTVTDNGIGFDTDGASNGYGLRLIRAIAGQLGGTADVQSVAGEGSAATLNFPLREVKAAKEPPPAISVQRPVAVSNEGL